jgi:hypothetical protein
VNQPAASAGVIAFRAAAMAASRASRRGEGVVHHEPGAVRQHPGNQDLVDTTPWGLIGIDEETFPR